MMREEKIAREYCRSIGINPDDVCNYTTKDRDGQAWIHRNAPKWERVLVKNINPVLAAIDKVAGGDGE